MASHCGEGLGETVEKETAGNRHLRRDGIGSLMGGNRGLGLFSLLLGVLAPIPALLIPWPLAATEEAYGILVMDAWVLIERFK